ncbi:Scr1 family TA system antitoxin-like transcriptional regulator [Micromonospora sp. NBC_01813]|uniref:Scr1 family TA system antitoxin-like transcriptional regulator n=1 Tax=Micromonospora sp. NBC_01813 TaxID=2975988 RepID=UPI003FA3B5D2
MMTGQRADLASMGGPGTGGDPGPALVCRCPRRVRRRFHRTGLRRPDDPDIAYVESHVGARYLERPEELAEYRRIFRQVREQSIPIEEHLV